jgi:hypothetical protein
MRSLSKYSRAGLALAASAGVGLVAAFTVRRRRVSHQISDLVDRLHSEQTRVASDPYDPDDLADLPAPVRRYFETVLTEGQLPVSRVRITQEGTFRLGGADADWYPFTASQTYSVSPPGYVWDADIELAPGVSARVLDAYVDGEGLLRANLLGALPVASAGPDTQTNEAELQRYLSETPWFPTALLPAAGVSWEGIDDQCARATFTDGDITATAVFHFDEDGYITRVTADRYRQDTDSMGAWVGYHRSYEIHDGMKVPTEAEVGWETPDGVVPYWRGRITDREMEFR